MEMCRVKCFLKSNKRILYASLFVVVFLVCVPVFAQNGVAGIDEANSKVREYFKAGMKLMYAVGAVVGLIGAIRVYNKWSSGDPDTGRVAASWFGACIFLVIVATVISSFFGVA